MVNNNVGFMFLGKDRVNLNQLTYIFIGGFLFWSCKSIKGLE